MLSKPGCTAGLALLTLALGPIGPDAFGQGNLFNPYGNSGYRDYREFTRPMYSNEPSLPGQARLQGGAFGVGSGRANQFEDFSDSLDGRDPEGAASGSISRNRPGVPYYRSYRQYDSDYKRVYRPNADADAQFAERLKARDAAYNRALEEKDPAKRAALLRQLSRNSLDRPMPPASKGTAKASAPARAARSTAPSAIPAPPGRDAAPRRAEAARPAARTPAPSTGPAASSNRPAASSTARAASPEPAQRQPSPAETNSVDPGSVPIPPPPR